MIALVMVGAGRRDLERVARLAPIWVGFAYLVVLSFRMSGLVRHNTLNADNASAPVIGELLHRAPARREAVLGNLPWYQQLWFEQATRRFPGHRLLWELFPFAVAIVGIILATAAVARAAGPSFAVLTAVVLFCASEPLVNNFFQGTAHSPTSAQVALLAATAVLLAARPEAGKPTLVAIVAVCGSLTAVGVASDPLLFVGGVGPFCLAAVMLWRLVSVRAATTAAGVVLVGVAGGAGLSALMHQRGFRTHSLGLRFADADKIAPNARLAIESFAYLGNGHFFGRSPGLRSAFAFLCGVLVLVALCAVVRACTGKFRERQIGDPVRAVFFVFWVACATSTLGAFVLTTAPVDLQSFRYLVPAWFAFASLLPVVLDHRRLTRLTLVAGVSIVSFASVVALARGDATDNVLAWPDRTLHRELRSTLQQKGLKVGYASYWIAAPITWGTDLALEVYPVYACTGETLCRFFFHNLSSWYVPRPKTRTYLIVDPKQPMVPNAPAAFGPASEVLTVGRLQVHVYPYDIASRFGTA